MVKKGLIWNISVRNQVRFADEMWLPSDWRTSNTAPSPRSSSSRNLTYLLIAYIIHSSMSFSSYEFFHRQIFADKFASIYEVSLPLIRSRRFLTRVRNHRQIELRGERSPSSIPSHIFLSLGGWELSKAIVKIPPEIADCYWLQRTKLLGLLTGANTA